MAKHKTPAPRAQRGETLAEVLVAMLIVALATLLLASMMMASSSVNTIARQKDEEFYTALSAVENLEPGSEPAQILIKPDSTVSPVPSPIPVKVYSSDGLALYKAQ